MRRSVTKLIVFLLITGSVIFILKIRTVNPVNSEVASLTTLSDADSSFFFIGSSRVQKSIDPNIIKQHYPEHRIFNTGMAGGLFLSNCVVADYLLQQRGHKVLYIELTAFANALPDGILNLASQTGLSPSRSVLALTESQSFSEQSMLIMKIINQQLYKSITVGNEVREIIGYKTDHPNNDWMGFSPYDKNDSQELNSFLTWEEVNTQNTISIDLTKYRAMIDHLNTLAKNNNARIFFFLPITCSNPVEKSIVIPLYRALPDSMKLAFPDHFLKQMRNADYLGDENHLNRKGATAYSGLLGPLLN